MVQFPVNLSEVTKLSQESTSPEMSVNAPEISIQGHKRPMSSISSIPDEDINDELKNGKFQNDPNSPEKVTSLNPVEINPKRPAKKSKKSSTTAIKEMLLPVKNAMDADPSQFIINFLELVSLFENSTDVTDFTTIASNYTSDLPGLLHCLQKLHPYYIEPSIKNRSTRLQNKLLAIIGESTESSETIASQ